METSENGSKAHRRSVVFPETEGVHTTHQRPSMSRNLYWFTGVPESYEIPVSNRKLLKMQARSNEEDEHGENILRSAALVTGFLELTTSHGISHIYNAKGIIKKCIWVLLALASFGLLLFHLTYMILSYTSFDVNTNIEIVEARSLDFPAITICNNNGIKEPSLPQRLSDIIDGRKSNQLDGSDDVRSNTATYRKLSEEVALMNSTEQYQLGYSQRDLIIYCTFNSENCVNDFWRHYDSVYGNCYTFNSGKTELEKSNLAGPANGLTLTINIGEYDYLPFLTEDAGIKIVIHDQKAMPFPGRDGIAVSPGQISNIAVKKLLVVRKGGRYGNCTYSTQNEENMYFEPYNVSYTQWACLRTCYQKELVNRCGCFDPELPYDSDSIVFSSLPAADKPCRTSNEVARNCTIVISDEFADRTLKCPLCYQPCEEVMFESSLSTSLYPAISYMGDFMNLLNRTHTTLLSRLKGIYGADHVADGIRSNFLKINVFYQQMTYTTYTQVPNYDTVQFVSDLGGAFGLWIGWSILTFFELIEFGIDLLVYLCYRYSVKNST